MTTKAQKLEAEQKLHPSYNITGIKKMTAGEIINRKAYGSDTLQELYASPSNAKWASYNEILATYKPVDMTLSGNSMTYSVILRTHDGLIMHITRNNNYLVEVEGL